MARGRKPGSKNQAQIQTQVQVPLQPEHTVFALDIGTRSVIGMVGVVEEDKVKIIAIDKEEHGERAMIDGQIENIEKVAALADKIKKRLEKKIHIQLNRVCVAAAGRALRTQRADFQLDLPGTQLIDDEIISRLEAGAISKAEEAFEAENRAEDGTSRRFYLVGYTVCQYYLDQYMISSLKDHRGQQVKVDLIATFLPSEVVESLYTTMNKIGLEVASITLEPIAAINAAIPGNLRLLNLVMVDIGAGTSDIAACTDGSVTGYTMATVAGDEITENIMKEYLVDFKTAEQIKMQIDAGTDVTFTDILGFEQQVPCEEIIQCIQGSADTLCREISTKILEVNGGAPSALFLAGGGSKLSGLKDKLTEALKMDAKRVAIAGRNFQANAFSDEYDLDNPEYATPLGIVISSGLNLIHDSFRVTLNDRPAKLFRSGSFTALNLLMMNGYTFQDLMGRSGQNLVVTVNGQRKVFYGTASQPASLFINKKEGKLSEIIHAGDCIDFIPAVYGAPGAACLGDIEGAKDCVEITLNGMYVPLETPLKNGDIILITMPEPPEEEETENENGDEKEDDRKAKQPSQETSHDTEAQAEPPEMSAAPAAMETAASLHSPDSNHQLTFDELPVQNSPSTSTGSPVPDHQPEADTSSTPDIFVSDDSFTDNRQTFSDASSSFASSFNALHPAQPPQPVPPAPDIRFYLNDAPLSLPPKEDGSPYYLMDMIQYSGIDLKNPRGVVTLTVNGLSGTFQQELKEGDRIRIEEEIT